MVSLSGSLGRYLLTLSIVTGLGAFALAADVYARMIVRWQARVLNVYAVVLAVAVAGGIAVLGWSSVAGRTEPAALGIATMAGLALGMIARRFDRLIVRYASRRSLDRSPTSRSPSAAFSSSGRGGRGTALAGASASAPARPTPTDGALLLGGSVRRRPGAHRGRDAQAQADPRQFGVATVIAVAVMEELFYRGVLLRAALLPGSWAAGLLVIATVVAFVLSHLTFGWAHVFAKAPLGVGAVAVVLILDGVLAAIVAHVWFNLSALRDVRVQTAGGMP